MNFIDKLRLALMLMTKGSRSGSDFLAMSNRRFCNSPNKVIGWHKGYPSYYLLAPPLMSRPACNSLLTRIMSIYQWRKLPDLVSVAVTDKCNANCEYCSFKSMEKNAPVLSTDDLKDAIRQCQELGAATIILAGGEPLMREDIGDIIASADKDLSQVILFTNGYYLKQRAKDLKKAGLTSVIVSIDSARKDLHDHKKGCEGLFDKALEGIARARKEKLLVGISSVLSRTDLSDGSIEALFDLGKKLRVNGMLLFDAIPTGGYADQSDVAFSSSELRQLIDVCAEYQRKNHYPGIHPYAYSKSHQGIGCAGGVSQCYISPYGDVCPCDFMPVSMGNIKDEPLYRLWDRFSDQGFSCTALSGCRRGNSAISHISNKMGSYE